MILTAKDKFKKLRKYGFIVELSKVDLFEKVRAIYPKDENKLKRPFEKIGKYQVMKGYDISFESLLDFWECTDENELIRLVAKTYLKIDNLDELPLFDCIRLIDYAKDIAVEAAEMFKTIKRDYTQEEIAAGIENIKSSHFDIVDRFCTRNGIADRMNVGYQTEWIVIFKCFESDFYRFNFEKQYNDVITDKYKNK